MIDASTSIQISKEKLYDSKKTRLFMKEKQLEAKKKNLEEEKEVKLKKAMLERNLKDLDLLQRNIGTTVKGKHKKTSNLPAAHKKTSSLTTNAVYDSDDLKQFMREKKMAAKRKQDKEEKDAELKKVLIERNLTDLDKLQRCIN